MINSVLSFLAGTPSYHLYFEAFLVLWLLWIIRQRKKAEKKDRLTSEDKEMIISAWKPRPLVDEKAVEKMAGYDNSVIWGPISGRAGKFFEIDGEKYLNVATHNYLGLVDNKELDNVAEQCIRQYGVGSCGPRGFYGTVDVHLELEKKIADFLGLEETALCYYAFAAVSSAIPSYAKAGDIIFADELVSFPIQQGLAASRSTVIYFKHNSWEDLQQKLEDQKQIGKRNPKKARSIRRFCVVEGIYVKSGTLCPLKEVAGLCKLYKVRLFVDETISFGILGKTGRGITEHVGVDLKDIDFISGSLEHGFASSGGFIVGPSYVIDHQRISGLGYCFSASLPPLLAGAGIKALEILERNPDIAEDVQDKCKYMHQSLEDKLICFKITSEELSPLKFLHLVGSEVLARSVERVIIYVKENYKIALIQPSYLDSEERKLPLPCIRISVNRLLSYQEVDLVAYAIEDACNTLNIFGYIIANINDEHEEVRNQMIQDYEAFLKTRAENKTGFTEMDKEALDNEEYESLEKTDDRMANNVIPLMIDATKVINM